MKHSVEFVVVEENLKPLLGKSASEQIGLMTINYENICVVNDATSIHSDILMMN